jgi:hypothetical protein
MTACSWSWISVFSRRDHAVRFIDAVIKSDLRWEVLLEYDP